MLNDKVGKISYVGSLKERDNEFLVVFYFDEKNFWKRKLNLSDIIWILCKSYVFRKVVWFEW